MAILFGACVSVRVSVVCFCDIFSSPSGFTISLVTTCTIVIQTTASPNKAGTAISSLLSLKNLGGM